VSLRPLTGEKEPASIDSPGRRRSHSISSPVPRDTSIHRAQRLSYRSPTRSLGSKELQARRVKAEPRPFSDFDLDAWIPRGRCLRRRRPARRRQDRSVSCTSSGWTRAASIVKCTSSSEPSARPGSRPLLAPGIEGRHLGVGAGRSSGRTPTTTPLAGIGEKPGRVSRTASGIRRVWLPSRSVCASRPARLGRGSSPESR